MIVETAIGAGSGLALLALFARMGNRAMADAGFIALASMIAIYIGAELVTGSLESIVTEMAVGSAATIAARLTMLRWPPAIGICVFMHGVYDAFFGAATGVASWYPPLCAGFDIAVGVGLATILHLRRPTGSA